MRKVILLALFWGTSVFGAEIRWIRLGLMEVYEDESVLCKASKPGEAIYFASEIENGKLARVVLSNYPKVWPYEPIYRSLDLLPQELGNIRLHRDSKGKYWLKEFPMTERMLKWMLYVGTQRSPFCIVPQPLLSIGPVPARYEFETDGIDQGIDTSYSQRLDLTGKRADGGAFRVSVHWIQKDFLPY